GGCLLTVRDYDREERGKGLVKPYGVRQEDGRRYIIFQVWDFEGDTYDLAMYFVVDDLSSERIVTHVMRTQYNAVGTDHLLALMGRAGFTRVERLDGRFYQPVLVGNREAGTGTEGRRRAPPQQEAGATESGSRGPHNSGTRERPKNRAPLGRAPR